MSADVTPPSGRQSGQPVAIASGINQGTAFTELLTVLPGGLRKHAHRTPDRVALDRVPLRKGKPLTWVLRLDLLAHVLAKPHVGAAWLLGGVGVLDLHSRGSRG